VLLSHTFRKRVIEMTAYTTSRQDMLQRHKPPEEPAFVCSQDWVCAVH
jgi:hypothetical protein